MGFLGKIIGLPDDESGLTFILSGRGKSPEISSDPASDNSSESSSNNSSSKISSYNDYITCKNCGKDGVKSQYKKEPCIYCGSKFF
jgi:hypothetical protein